VVVLVGSVALAWSNCGEGVFVFDDMGHIVNNRRLHRLGELIGAGRLGDLAGERDLLTGRARPLVHLTLAANHALGGLEPRGYHRFNVAVHALAALALFGVVRRTLARPGFGPRTRAAAAPLALAVALLWAVHPLQTQSVTYVIQRAESMMGLFYLLTIYCVIRGAETTRAGSRVGWQAAAVLAAALGMASKGIMVTAPVMVLLYDRFFLAGSFRGALAVRWKLYAGLAATWGILVATGVVASALDPTGTGSSTVGLSIREMTPLGYALTQPAVVLHYLQLAAWPNRLCLDYLWPVAAGAGTIVPPLLALLAIAAVAAWGALRWRWVGFAALWFGLVLLPTSSIVPIKDLAVEHRMYLPLAAIAAIAVAGGAALLDRLVERGAIAARAAVPAGVAAVALAAVALGATTHRRNRIYHDAVTMWADVVEARPANVRGWTNLGNALDAEQRTADAVEAYRRALQITPLPPLSERDPAYVTAHYNLGIALFNAGELEAAMTQCRAALDLHPRHAKAHANLGACLTRVGRPDAALTHYAQAIEIRPRFAEAHHGLGTALARLDRGPEAVAALERALELRPGYAVAHRDLGTVLGSTGRLDEAVTHLEAATRLAPGDAIAHLNLGSAYRQLGRLDDAIASFRVARSRDPGLKAAARLLAETVAERDAAGTVPP
jgi:tetratricopeptide (TPR) repeat protein